MFSLLPVTKEKYEQHIIIQKCKLLLSNKKESTYSFKPVHNISIEHICRATKSYLLNLFIYLKTELNKDIETKKWIQVELKVELNNSVIKFENPGENLTSGMNQTCFHD